MTALLCAASFRKRIWNISAKNSLPPHPYPLFYIRLEQFSVWACRFNNKSSISSEPCRVLRSEIWVKLLFQLLHLFFIFFICGVSALVAYRKLVIVCKQAYVCLLFFFAFICLLQQNNIFFQTFTLWYVIENGLWHNSWKRNRMIYSRLVCKYIQLHKKTNANFTNFWSVHIYRFTKILNSATTVFLACFFFIPIIGYMPQSL